jgi:multiple sugar transport system permease protein
MYPRLLPHLLILPAALFTVVFFVYPMVLVSVAAFTDAGGAFTLKHFQTMFGHWKFGATLGNTLMFAALVVPIQLVVALCMAQMLTQVTRARDMLLYLWTIPLGICDLAAGIVWLAIFEQTGFLNSLLVGLGLRAQPVSFLGYDDTFSLLVAIVLAEIWRSTGTVLVILASGIGMIPREYREAAEVFGAGPWQKFLRVTLPLLRPTLQTALILRTIFALEVFAVIVALSGTRFPVLMGEAYHWQFTLQDGAVASAMALVLLLLSALTTLFYLRVLRVPAGVRM